PQFWLILGIAALVIWLKMRKAVPKPTSRDRQITLRGIKVTTKITKSTPAACLRSEGKTFGPDHHEKVPPTLPHGENCECVAEDLNFKIDEFFDPKNKKVETFETDLGPLDALDTRYYKYKLLCSNPEISEAEKASYSELMQRVEVSETFKKLVEAQLNDKEK
ncbi:MAG: hypothetical protein QNL04_03625, partial [SAR324 cluster bacterium]|nr:hypothetical protein [SAR324 cluster bacterium]